VLLFFTTTVFTLLAFRYTEEKCSDIGVNFSVCAEAIPDRSRALTTERP